MALNARRRPLRFVSLVQRAFCVTAAPALLLLVSLIAWWEDASAADTSVIALILPQSTGDTAGNESGGGYFPLSNALRSVIRLAADDVNAGSLSSLTGGNLTLSFVEVGTGTRAMEGFCTALEAVGTNGTFGVSFIPHCGVVIPLAYVVHNMRTYCTSTA